MRGTCLDRSLSSDLSTLRGIELLGPNGSAKTADWCWEFANQAAIPAVISGPATVAPSVPAERQAYAVAAGGHMQFDWSAEQLAYRDSVRDFAARELDDKLVERDAASAFSVDAWRK